MRISLQVDVTDDVIVTNDEIGVNQGGLDLTNISQNKKLKCYYCQEYGHSVYQSWLPLLHEKVKEKKMKDLEKMKEFEKIKYFKG